MKLKISQPKVEITYQIGDKLNSTMCFLGLFCIKLISKKSDLIMSHLFNFVENIYRLIFVDFQSFFLI